MFKIFERSINQSINKKYIEQLIIDGGTSAKSIKNVVISNYEVFKSFKINKLNFSWFYIFLKF